MTEHINVLSLDLPEIADRDPFQPPTQRLEKTGANTWAEVDGRRDSRTLLVNQVRPAVAAWRAAGYPGVTATSRRLLAFWFEDDHLLPSGQPFRFYYCQQEAMETLIFLFEVERVRDCADLISRFFKSPDLLELDILTSSKGERFIRRYIPEIGKSAEQELPPAALTRYAIKMATGSGKTLVIALVVVWSYLNRRLEAGSDCADNFLLLAPNVIVYERLREDFDSGAVFHSLPMIPPEWHSHFGLQVILRGEARDPGPDGTLFLTNIQQIYEDTGPSPGPINPVAALLGKAPKPNLDTATPMLERIKRLPNLLVMNDEAHHVHDEDLAWSKTLMALHANLKAKGTGGLVAWLDFTATPKNQNGTFFPWIIADYPLAQTVEDRIVKTPLIIHQTDKQDPDKYAAKEAGDVYNEWIAIAVERWREHVKDYGAVGEKPLLFVMAESTKDADSIAERLRREPEFKGAGRVLVIHTDKTGEITKKDLDLAREAAREVDEGKSRVCAIVSVLMLREGWDVRNVSVILGLRPFTAKASILPEQAIGRGLRLMRKVPRNNHQVLELIGTNAFENFIRELEKEGVGIPTTVNPPKPGREIFPLRDRLHLDIAIPRTTALYERSFTRLAQLDPLALSPLGKEEDLDREVRNQIDLVHGTVDVKVGSDEIEFNADNLPPIENLLSSLANRVEKRAKLPGHFAEIYPLVRAYVHRRCFSGVVELDDAGVRRALGHSGLLDAVAGLFSREIGRLTVEATPLRIEGTPYRLSDTSRFTWRRFALPARKTIFNLVACYNPFEAEFAAFLDGCDDIERFAALAEWFTEFHVQYLSGTGAVRFYYPDFVGVQQQTEGVTHWIIETKGREFDDTDAKARHMERWCAEVSQATGETWRYLKVSQPTFQNFIAKGSTRSFAKLLAWKHPQGSLI